MLKKPYWLLISETSIIFVHCRLKTQTQICLLTISSGIYQKTESLRRIDNPKTRAAALLCWRNLEIVASITSCWQQGQHARAISSSMGLWSQEVGSAGRVTPKEIMLYLLFLLWYNLQELPFAVGIWSASLTILELRMKHELQNSQSTLGSLGWWEEHWEAQV